MAKANINKFNSPFATRLRSLMEEHGTKKTELAELLNVTRQSVGQYCDGTSVPPVDKIIIIAKKYNVTTDYILGLTDVKAINTNVKAICEYTGLTEKSIENLKDTKTLFFKETVNFLLENNNDSKSLLNFIRFYLYPTIINDAIKNTKYGFIQLPTNSRYISGHSFGVLVENLPLIRNNLKNEILNNKQLLDNLCLKFLSSIISEHKLEEMQPYSGTYDSTYIEEEPYEPTETELLEMHYSDDDYYDNIAEFAEIEMEHANIIDEILEYMKEHKKGE